eukprot:1159144-Pelagomonas_calceolata.AAC.6
MQGVTLQGHQAAHIVHCARTLTIWPHAGVACQVHQAVGQHTKLGSKGSLAGISHHAAQQVHGVCDRGKRVAARHAQSLPHMRGHGGDGDWCAVSHMS